MGIAIQFIMDVNVYDEKAFREAARDQAIKDGMKPEDAATFLDEEQQTLGSCAVMIFDPGESPAGCDIQQSNAE